MSNSRSASLIAEVRASPEDLVLSRALSAVPEIVVEFERFVPTNDSPMPFLWTTGGHCSAFEGTLEEDPTVENATLLDTYGDDGLFEVEWADVSTPLFVWFRRGGGEVLQAVGQDDEWLLEIRFRDRTSLKGFQEYCGEEGIDFTLLRERHRRPNSTSTT